MYTHRIQIEDNLYNKQFFKPFGKKMRKSCNFSQHEPANLLGTISNEMITANGKLLPRRVNCATCLQLCAGSTSACHTCMCGPAEKLPSSNSLTIVVISQEILKNWWQR